MQNVFFYRFTLAVNSNYWLIIFYIAFKMIDLFFLRACVGGEAYIITKCVFFFCTHQAKYSFHMSLCSSPRHSEIFSAVTSLSNEKKISIIIKQQLLISAWKQSYRYQSALADCKWFTKYHGHFQFKGDNFI